MIYLEMRTQQLRKVYRTIFEENTKLSAVAFRRAIRKDIKESNPQTLAELSFIQTDNLESVLVDRYQKNGIRYGNLMYNDLSKFKKRFNPVFSQDWARHVRDTYVFGLNSKIILLKGTIRDEVTRMVDKAIIEGDDVVSLSEAIQKTVNSNEFYYWQAERIARTEVGGAMNQATEVAVDSLDIEVRKRWLSGTDGRERDSHRDLNGAVVDRNETFENGLLYPHDPQGEAEEVINCRCVVQYVPVN